MATNDSKQISIGAKIDAGPMRVLNNQIKEMKKNLDDLAKTLNASINKGFEKLTKELRFDTKGLSEFRKSIVDVDKSLQTQIKTLATYSKSLQAVRGTAAGGAGAFSSVGGGGGGKPPGVTGGGGAAGSFGGMQLFPLPGGGYVFVPPGGQGPGGGGGGGGNQTSRWLATNPDVNRQSKFGGMAAGAISDVLGGIAGFQTGASVNAGNIIGGVRGQIHQNLFR